MIGDDRGSFYPVDRSLHCVRYTRQDLLIDSHRLAADGVAICAPAQRLHGVQGGRRRANASRERPLSLHAQHAYRRVQGTATRRLLDKRDMSLGTGLATHLA